MADSVKKTDWFQFLQRVKNKQTQPEVKTEEYTVEKWVPGVDTTDLGNGLVKVEILIEGLEPGRDKFHPKGGNIDFDFKNSGHGFEMTATFKDRSKRLETTYVSNVKQLPGRIDITESKWNVEKGKIVIMMEKHAENRNLDWRDALWKRGIDQVSSSSSSSSSDSD